MVSGIALLEYNAGAARPLLKGIPTRCVLIARKVIVAAI